VASTPGAATAIPSAIVEDGVTETGRPAAIDAGTGAMASACTPMTCAAGSTELVATATPEHRPPPPTGTTIVRACGHCSPISSPTVPWPAITSAWSNGWMKIAPVCSASSRARLSASSTDTPCSTTSAP
jgi:hypothetical protein